MKAIIKETLEQALTNLKANNSLLAECSIDVKVDNCKDKQHGDYSSNIALVLAKNCKLPPLDVANLIIAEINQNAIFAKIETAGPGFINFFINAATRLNIIKEVLTDKQNYGHCDLGQDQKILLEYVSANPTGPLHVGHGRSAAFGATLANLLRVAGFTIQTEYYVNNAGRQMNILAVSVWLRYLELTGIEVDFPSNGYKGDYVKDIAQVLFDRHGLDFRHNWLVITESIKSIEDPEPQMDELINTAKKLLGSGFEIFKNEALNSVLDDIKCDLREFGVEFDNWFSEQSLISDGAIDKGILALVQKGHTYTKNGALWFNSVEFGDEKDRVLSRSNGQTTYFASDVAYHWHKFNRGFTKVINVFGADHHGYVPRLKACVKALGHNDNDLQVMLVQFAILYRNNQRVQMSTRSGSFVTLRELRDEVGNDAARFFYVQRKPEQHMDFDLDLAKSKSNENPVYYIQYAHARICSVFSQLQKRNYKFDLEAGLEALDLLNLAIEESLIHYIMRYKDAIKSAALSLEPHQIAYYLKELAALLHAYYNQVPLICDDESLRNARLCLIKAVEQVLKNGLEILGVSAPSQM